MTVTEVKQALGSWDLRLRSSTPKEILDGLTYLGHIAVLPGRLSPAQFNDNLLRAARYVGVFRGRSATDEFVLKGVGMAFWLGDEDDKGDVFETPVDLTAQTFANSITALLPPGGSVIAGAINSVAGTYTGHHQYQTPRQALTYVADTFGAEWRVNGDATLDAGTVSQMYVTAPKTMLLRKINPSSDLFRTGLPGSMGLETDVEDYTTRVVLLAEGEGDAIATGSADAGAVPYKDIRGNTVKLTRMVSEGETSSINADTRAQLALNRFTSKRNAVELSTDMFDVKGIVVVGDYIDVYDPDTGFIDPNREVIWEGRPINPIALRCVEMSWPIPVGWTVAFRDTNGKWWDLSQHYAPEAGETTITVGEFNNNLTEVGSQPIGDRTGSIDTSIPAAPTFNIPFGVGTYQTNGETSTTKAVIRASWPVPLNMDGSTILDGHHYEIRYRPSQYIGYKVKWGQLSGYNVLIDDKFDRNLVFPSGWGDATSGQPWIVDPVHASWMTVSSAVGGKQSHFVLNTKPYSLIGSGITNCSIVRDVAVSALVTGGDAVAGNVFRWQDANNYYWLRTEFVAGSTAVNLRITKVVAGVAVDIATLLNVPGVNYSPNVPLRTHAEVVVTPVVGATLRIKVWNPNLNEPVSFQLSTTDNAIGAGGQIGELSWLPATNTNALPFEFIFDNWRAVDLTLDGFEWGDLSGNRWGAPITDPVSANPEWLTSYVPWGTNTVTINELTPGMTYELQVRAVDAANPPHLGPYSDVAFVTTSGDLFAPSTPAVATVAASLIGIQVTHSLGQNAGGTFNLEPDLDHLDVHVGGDATFYPDSSNKIGEMVANIGLIQARIPAVGSFKVNQADLVWVKIVAVDRTGNKSGASPGVQATATLIDNAHITDLSVSKLTAGTLTANTILGASIGTAVTGQRTVMDMNGIHGYDSSGTESIQLDTAGTFRIKDASGDAQVEMGKLSDGDYGLAAVNPTDGNLVKLQDFIFGPRVSNSAFVCQRWGAGATVYGDGLSFGTPNPGPDLTCVISETGRAMVILTCGIDVDSNCQGGHMSFEMWASNGTQFDIASDQFAVSFSFGPNTLGWSAYAKYSSVFYLEGLPVGPMTFLCKYRAIMQDNTVNGGAQFTDRQIAVIPY